MIPDEELAKIEQLKRDKVPHTIQCQVTGKMYGECPDDHPHVFRVVLAPEKTE